MMDESRVHQVGLQKGAGVVVSRRRTLLRGPFQGERTSAEGAGAVLGDADVESALTICHTCEAPLISIFPRWEANSNPLQLLHANSGRP